jgi:trimethylamine--corrinoid protein Co-methyltransferase
MTLRAPSAGFLASGGFSLNTFTNDELKELHRATLEILEHTGVYVQMEEARRLFREGGASVDEDGVVTMPPWLVDESIRSAPERLTLGGRIPSRDCVIEAGRVTFTCFGEGISIIDPFNGEYRPTRKDDLKYSTRIIDSLDVISVVERCVGSQDVPAPVQVIHNYEAIVNNTTKPVFLGPENGAKIRIILEMARAAVGDERIKAAGYPVSFITCPVSPLRLVEDCCDIIITCARENVPICILSMAMSGGSAPVNLAGTLVTHNAEVLAGTVLSQLAKKGAKVVYGSSTTAMNLKMATACVGSPELAMINAAVASIARFYGLPSWVAGG